MRICTNCQSVSRSGEPTCEQCGCDVCGCVECVALHEGKPCGEDVPPCPVDAAKGFFAQRPEDTSQAIFDRRILRWYWRAFWGSRGGLRQLRKDTPSKNA